MVLCWALEGFVRRSLFVLFALLTSVTFGSAQQTGCPGGDAPRPVPTKAVEPEYSKAARDARIEGVVLLSIVVDESGLPTQIKVQRWSLKQKEGGDVVEDALGLDQSAMDAVRKWRFRPGQKDGKPVAVRANVEINFRL
ncbi:energy transducer TonB [uncultured Paludibaculum sp.]|uniref:energy transducer TonB n=1 Tax=uncultured Paludibaculum sp. TaxID=1765020 RepID=UPI002AABD5D9|nr:energy transducer TonB [uncultured Paludibaculum sp.]